MDLVEISAKRGDAVVAEDFAERDWDDCDRVTMVLGAGDRVLVKSGDLRGFLLLDPGLLV